MTVPLKLPAVTKFSNDWSKWSAFVEILYAIFSSDFLEKPQIIFQKKNVAVSDYVGKDDLGKEALFWHLITKDDFSSQTRIPDLERAERIGWIKFLIEHYDQLKTWKYLETTQRGTAERWYVWAEAEDFIVILEEKPHLVQLITAFHVETWNKPKLEKKYQNRLK